MSYSRKEGKDEVIFVTKEEHEAAINNEDYEDEQEGLINEDGSINWDCPCLGGMASGPCGVEFRESFTCFHYSTEEPKGTDCMDSFRTLNDCMMKYPDYFGKKSGSRSSSVDGERGGNEDIGAGEGARSEHRDSADDKSQQSDKAEVKEGKS